MVALGADYDLAATPGFVEGGFEYSSVGGAERLRDELPSFRGGKVLLAVLSIPFKCPPAPYEGILLLHDYLVELGIRDATQLHVVTPQPAPIPVSPEASEAVERTMAARGIEYTKRRRVYGIDPINAAAPVTHSPVTPWRNGHRYSLPAFTERMTSRLGTHCEDGHQAWPAKAATPDTRPRSADERGRTSMRRTSGL